MKKAYEHDWQHLQYWVLVPACLPIGVLEASGIFLCELFPFSGRKLQRKENVFHGSVEGKSNSATFSYIRDFFIIFLQLFCVS